MIINIEVQNDFYPGYPLVKRGIYYGGRMLSAQYGIRNMMKLLQLPMEQTMVVMEISEEKKAYYTSLLLQDSEPSM